MKKALFILKEFDLRLTCWYRNNYEIELKAAGNLLSMSIFNRQVTSSLVVVFMSLVLSSNTQGSRTKSLEDTQEQHEKRLENNNRLKRKYDESQNQFQQTQVKQSKIRKDLEHDVQYIITCLKPFKTINPIIYKDIKSHILTLLTTQNPNTTDYYKKQGHIYWDAAETFVDLYKNKECTSETDILSSYPLNAHLYEQAAQAYRNSLSLLNNETNKRQQIQNKLIKFFERIIEAYRLAAANWYEYGDFEKAVLSGIKATEMYEQQLETCRQSVGEDENEILGNLYRDVFSSAVKAKHDRALEWGKKSAHYYDLWVEFSDQNATSYQYDYIAQHYLQLATHSKSALYFYRAAIFYGLSLDKSGTHPPIYNNKSWGDIAYIYSQAARSAEYFSDTYNYFRYTIEAYEKYLTSNPRDDVTIFESIRESYTFILTNCLWSSKDAEAENTVRIKVLSRLAQLQTRFYILPHVNTGICPHESLLKEYEETLNLYTQAHEEAVKLKNGPMAQAFLDEKSDIRKLMQVHFSRLQSSEKK